METGNSSESDKLKNQSPEQDNENADERKNMNQSNKKVPGAPGNPNYKSNKGTGMSSEAGANQSEESWQDTGGGNPASVQNDMNNANQSRGSGNMSNVGMSTRNMGGTSDEGLGGTPGSGSLNTDNIKNQSDQQRRSSMDDGTPEMPEKNMKDTKLPDEELNDTGRSNSENK